MTPLAWNCSYIQKRHTWVVDKDQDDCGVYGVRVHCSECPQVDTLYAPYARYYLDNARLVATESI